jgi:predicted GNAT family acetyltransferase
MRGPSVDATDDPREALSVAHDFLTANPIEHNLVLTLLHDRVAEPTAGRYWWAHDGDRVEGFVLQSPRTFRAALTPIPNAVVPALGDAVAADAPDLPGVMGDAATTARFAGCWTDRLGVGATPSDAGRLYRLGQVTVAPRARGRLRLARTADRELLIPWVDFFHAATGPGAGDTAAAVDRRLREERLWVWEDGDVASMALATRPVAGVVRIGWVYTPVEQRGRGYATACVAALSDHVLTNEANTCILYTELANPTSNAIYKRVGYEPVSEILTYRFDRA